MGVNDVEDGPAVDDREMEVHGPPRCPYSSFAVQVGSKTVSRYGVPRSAHTNNTVGRLGPPPPSFVAYRLTAAYTVPPEPPANRPCVCSRSRHAAVVTRSGIITTSSILARDSKRRAMLYPTP